MNINFGAKLHNRFDAVLSDAKTGKVKQVAKAENVVLNYFWNNFFTGYAINYVHIGTGTGTPAVTDTTLFNFLSSSYIDGIKTINTTDGHTYVLSWNITVSENSWIGDLTEIGLARSEYNARLCTHALFTDSEGNPISIHKTSADRLTLTITVYVEISYSNPANGVIITMNRRNGTTFVDPRPTYNSGDTFSTSATWYSSLFLNSMGSTTTSQQEMYTSVTTLFITNQYRIPAQSSRAATYSFNNTTLTARISKTTRTTSNEQNTTYPSTYLIKNINTPEIQVMLPNPNVYPARLHTLIQVADGQTTEFNFGIPILKTTGVKVYIDNVLQSENTYNFYGRNFKHTQAWDSADTLYLKKIIRGSGGTAQVGCVLGVYSTYGDTCSYYYDFETDYTVSAVGKYLPASAYLDVLALYYSADNSNWTQLSIGKTPSEWSTLPNIDALNGIINVIPISARYWRVDISVRGRTVDQSQLQSVFLFGDAKPQLQFNTAPPANAEIKIEAYCEYPIKNENWIIETGMTFDYTVTRH